MKDNENPVTKSLCGDFPDWKSVVISLAPLLMRALTNKHTRSFMLRKLGDFTRKYMTFWASASKDEKQVRKGLIKKHGLKQMSQKQYDELEIREGKRICPSGYDYSNVLPGNTPCCFYSVNPSDATFLGHHKTWPDRSYFNNSCIFGKASTTGTHSSLDGVRLLSEVVVGTNSLMHNCRAEDAIKVCVGVRMTGSNRFGDSCMFSDDVQMTGDMNQIGNNLVTGQGFKLTGLDNSIGNSARIGELAFCCNTVFGDDLQVDSYSELISCTVPDGKYELTQVKISGSESKSAHLGVGGKLSGSTLGSHVFTSDNIKYDRCVIKGVDAIAKNSRLISCKVLPPKGHKVLIRGGTKIKGGQLKNVCLKGAPNSRITVTDTDVKYAQIYKTTLVGQNCSIDNSYLYDGVNCSKVGVFGPNIKIDGTVKLQDLSIHVQPSQMYSNESSVTMINTLFAISDTEISFHHTNNANAKIALKKCNLQAFTNYRCNDAKFKLTDCEVLDSTTAATPGVQDEDAYAEAMAEEQMNAADESSNALYHEYAEATASSNDDALTRLVEKQPTRASVLPKANIVVPFDQTNNQTSDMSYDFDDTRAVVPAEFPNTDVEAPNDVVACVDEEINRPKI